MITVTITITLDKTHELHCSSLKQLVLVSINYQARAITYTSCYSTLYEIYFNFSYFRWQRVSHKKRIFSIVICVVFTWWGFSGGGAAGVASVRRVQPLPHPEQAPAGSKRICHCPEQSNVCTSVSADLRKHKNK